MKVCHFPPNVPCVCVSQEAAFEDDDQPHDSQKNTILQHAVIVDFGKQFVAWKNRALAYKDLSETGDAEYACAYIQSTLEWAQQMPGAYIVLVPDLDGRFNSSFSKAIQSRFRAEAVGTPPIRDLNDLPRVVNLPS